MAVGAEARGADPVCIVAPRDLEPPSRDSPPLNTPVRVAGGGGPTRADAERAGTSARALAGAVFGPTDEFLALAAETESFATGAAETAGEELAGTLPFTNRCSLASYTMEELPPREAFAMAALLEVTERITRAGVATELACETNASRGGSFTTFHFVLAASADCAVPAGGVSGMTPCARFTGVFP